MMIDKIIERRKNGTDDFQNYLSKLGKDIEESEKELSDLNQKLLSKNQELLDKAQNN